MNIADEPLLTLRDAAALMPGRGGKSRSPRTLWKWHHYGLRGVKLETRFAGGDLVTSVAAIQRFLDAVTRIRCNELDIVPPVTRRTAGYLDAAKRLREVHGIR